MGFLIICLMAVVILCALRIVIGLNNIFEQQKKSNEFLNSIESEIIELTRKPE